MKQNTNQTKNKTNKNWNKTKNLKKIPTQTDFYYVFTNLDALWDFWDDLWFPTLPDLALNHFFNNPIYSYTNILIIRPFGH